MPDPYMPDVQVEIAFTSGYTTPDASRVWTDVSPYVELAHGISITFGRQDELSVADANDLTLVLDNSDGRFTAGRGGSPYYPNVKVGRPIRVTATPPGGVASRRFVGFINQWPVEWDGTDAYAKTTITATSRLSRLGLGQVMRSMPEAAILAAGPRLYWTLSDPSTTTAAIESAGASGGGQRLLRTEADPSNPGVPVAFGDATGPGTDGLTAATFDGTLAAPVGQYLQAETLGIPAGPRTIRASVRLLSLPSGSQGDALLVSGDGLKLGVDAAGLLRGVTTTGPSVNDGLTHDVALTLDGTTERLYLDGALVHSVAAGTPSATNLLTVGALANVVLAHVAVYETALTGAQIADQAETMAAATVTERTDERLSRILGWVGVAASEISTQTGAETMTYQQTSGMSVVDALRECESTEGGVLFDGQDGRVTFHNRSHRYTATVAATLAGDLQQVEADYAPKLDRSTLTNDVTVENPTTGESARSTDSASITEYGVATSSAKSVASTYDPLQQKAAWLVASYAEPRSRVPSLTVDVLAQVGATPSAQTLLGVTIGDVLAVTKLPPQAQDGFNAWDLGADALGSETTLGDGNATYFIEGYSEAIGPESYRITFNLSPTSPTLDTFVLDSSERGELDSDNVLAY